MQRNGTMEIEPTKSDEGDSLSPLLPLGSDAFAFNNPVEMSFQDGPMEAVTIIYNRKVNVYFLPRHRAEKIMRWMELKSAKVNTAACRGGSLLMPTSLLDNLRRDMPLTRKKSLETFLLRRKARLSLVNQPPTSLREISNINTHQSEGQSRD